MERNGSGVSALLGLDGFVVRAQLLDEDSDEWWLVVETTEDRAWCPTCGVRAVGHGRRRVKVRDLQSLTGRSCWCGPKGCGAAPSRPVRQGRGRRSPTRSPLDRAHRAGPSRDRPPGRGG
jgi:hypothetical protein